MKLSKKFSFFSAILSLSLAFLFTACEGFFTNNDVDDKIRAAIDYANAPYSTFVVSADSNAGTIIPSGQVNYKPTDTQIITFTLKPQYQFIKWNFSYKEISKGSDSPTLTATDPDWWKDYITIKKETVSEPNAKGEIEYVLEIQFTKATENLLIEPVCSLKPEIKSFSPSYDLKGVSREAQVSVEFNSSIDTTTLFFSQSEIDTISGITYILKNDQNQIYAYEKDDKRFFKNLEIFLGNAELNINDYYGDLSYRQEINTLFLTPKKPVEIVGDVVEIKIHFMDGIKNTNGASITDTTKVFCVNKSTNQKADIAIKYTEGSPTQNNKIDAFVDQEIVFPSDETLQFLYWKLTANSPESLSKITIYNDSDKLPSMKFCANAVILPSEGVTITAVYKKRPEIVTNGFTPIDQNNGVDKDSEIKIVFSEPVSLDSFKSGYKISCDGNDVKENFDVPIYDPEDTTNKTIIIKATSNTISVSLGEKKKVTVTIPGGLYYEYIDTSNGITYQITAGQDIVRSYKINSDTNEKAYITFPAVNSDMGSFSNPGRSYYCVGDTFSILFNEPKYGQQGFQKYQFLGWIIPENISTKIECKQSDLNSLLYEFTIKGTIGNSSSPVSINADVREKLRVIDFSPEDSADGVAKDSDIEITFNYEPQLSACKSLITIAYNGVSYPESFPISGWTINQVTDSNSQIRYKLTIPASSTNRLAVSNKGRVQVTIDSNLSYTSEDGKTISISENSRVNSYCVNDSTKDWATLTVNEVGAEGSISYRSKDKYSMGERIALSFNQTSDYEFLYWQTDNDSVVSFDERFEKNTTMTVNAPDSASISAVCTPKLKLLDDGFTIIKDEISGAVSPVGGPYPKDSDIILNFNHSIDNPEDELNEYLKIYIGGDINNSIYRNYTYSASDAELTFTAKQDERIQINSNQTISVRLLTGLYYEYRDSVITEPKKIYLKQNETKSFTIDTSTIKKASVQVINDESAWGKITDTSNNNFTTETNDYSKDKSFTINFTPEDDYQFICWTVSGTSSNVSLSNYANTTTTVTVINSDDDTAVVKPYCVPKLTVASISVIEDDQEYNLDENPNKTFRKDSTFVVTMSKPLTTYQSRFVHLKYNGVSLEGDVFELQHEDNTAVFKFVPKTNKYALVSGTGQFVVEIDKRISYIENYQDTIYKDVGLSDNYSKGININLKTLVTHTIKTQAYEYHYIKQNDGTIVHNQQDERDNAGDFTIGKQYECYAGQEIDFSFIPNEYFLFVEHKITVKDSNGYNINPWDNLVFFETDGSDMRIIINSSEELVIEIEAYTRRKVILGECSHYPGRDEYTGQYTTITPYTTLKFWSSGRIDFDHVKPMKVFRYYSSWDDWNEIFTEEYIDVTQYFRIFMNGVSHPDKLLDHEYYVYFDTTNPASILFPCSALYLALDTDLLRAWSGYEIDGIDPSIKYRNMEINGKNYIVFEYWLSSKAEEVPPVISIERLFVQEQAIDPFDSDGNYIPIASWESMNESDWDIIGEDEWIEKANYYEFFTMPWPGQHLTTNTLMYKVDENWGGMSFVEDNVNRPLFDLASHPETVTKTGKLYYYFEIIDYETDVSESFDITITPLYKSLSPGNPIFEGKILTDTTPITMNKVSYRGGALGILDISSFEKDIIYKIVINFYDINMNKVNLVYYVYYSS
jgi:hypothetical protein